MKRIFVAALGKRDPATGDGRVPLEEDSVHPETRQLLDGIVCQPYQSGWLASLGDPNHRPRVLVGPVFQALLVLWKHKEIRHHKLWLIHDETQAMMYRATATGEFVSRLHHEVFGERTPDDFMDLVQIEGLQPHLYDCHVKVASTVQRRVAAHLQHSDGEVAFDILVSSGTPALGTALMLAAHHRFPNPTIWQAMEPWRVADSAGSTPDSYLCECHIDGNARRIRFDDETVTGLELELRNQIDVLKRRITELEQEHESLIEPGTESPRVHTKEQHDQMWLENFERAWREEQERAAMSDTRFNQGGIARRLGVTPERVSQLKKQLGLGNWERR